MADDAALQRARERLSTGAWADAKASFEDAIRDDRSPEALFGIGVSAWWLGDTEAALSGWEHSYTAAMERGDPERAVLAAVYLCLGYEMSLANEAVATAWADRAQEMVTELDFAPLLGWVLLCRAHLANDHGRPSDAERCARQAIELARGGGDVDLELCATAELGTALVESGRSEDGLGLLGRAMARALAGEANDLDAVVLIGCRVVTSCSRASDPKRAMQWVRAADDFNDRYGSPHLFRTCRVHYGAVLVMVGAWDDAERELLAALEIGRRAEPALHTEATAKLAELRLAQGRIDDGERLLRGLESEPGATYAVSGLLLARGEPSAAASIVERRLGQLPEGCLEASRLWELLGVIDVTRGALQDAADRGRMLLEQGMRLRCAPIAAGASRLLGRAALVAGDAAQARTHLERAMTTFEELGLVVDQARTRLLLARALATIDAEAAVAEARAALHAFEMIEATRDADEAAALIRSLGGRARRGGPGTDGLLTRRELEVAALVAEGLGNREVADRLFITRKTVEHHVSSILTKLGLSGRAELAAHAAGRRSEDPRQR